MKKFILLLIALCICTQSFAQTQIVRYEYWFNNNYANAVTETVTPNEEITLNTFIPAPNLSAGLNKLFIRFMDNQGVWSSPLCQYVVKNADNSLQTQIVQYEYWFNNNYADAVTEAVTPNEEITLNTSIPVTNLPTGLNKLFVRFMDNQGVWSSPLCQYVVKNADNSLQTQIVQYEYWFNNNYADAVTETINPNEEITLNTFVPEANLPAGLNKLFIRFMDNQGVWSSPLCQYVVKNADNSLKNDNVMVLCEYWFNDNRNQTQTIEIDSTATFIILEDFDISVATKATNKIYFRFKDKYGFWSSVSSTTFWRPVEAGFTHIAGLLEVAFTNTSKYADTYRWNFGDGNTSTQVNPEHEYAEPGAYLVELIASNPQFKDTVSYYVEIEGIRSISNNKGGNEGYSSFNIYGGGLSENTTVKLVKNGVVISTYLVYQREPGVICATFDLTGKAIGVYNVVVTINGTDYTITDGFTIEEAREPKAWTEIEGNTIFIAGRWQTYTVNYGNAGNSDIYGLPINLIFSDIAEFEFLFDLVDAIGEESTDINNPDNYVKISSLYGDAFNGKMYSILIPHIPANTKGSFSFRLKIDISSATRMYANIGEVLNDIYFHTQENVVATNSIFGYNLVDTFNINKEDFSQQIRSEINNSFIQSILSKKSFVNFSKLLTNSVGSSAALAATSATIGQKFNRTNSNENEIIDEPDCIDTREPDCAGVRGGSATLDECRNCVGGTTERLPCTQSIDNDNNRANPLAGDITTAPPNPNNPEGALYGTDNRTNYDGTIRGHDGIDLAAPEGTNVYAQFDGVIDRVIPATDGNAAGNRIYVNHTIGNDAVELGYFHLQEGTPIANNPQTGQPWRAGDTINQGELIGHTGITGNANANVPHLHIRARANGQPADPANYLILNQ